MKNKKLLTVSLLLLTLVVSLFLASCYAASDGDVTPDSPDYSQTGGTLTQEKTVDEGDVVKTFADYAYKLQSDGVTVYKLDNGTITLKAYYKFKTSRCLPIEMYVTDESIAVIYGKTDVIDDDYGYRPTNYGKNENYSKVFIEILNNKVVTEQDGGAIDLSAQVKYSFSITADLLASRTYVSSKLAYFAFSSNEIVYNQGRDVTNDDDVTTAVDSHAPTIAYTENGSYKTFDNATKVPGITEVNTSYSPIIFVSIDLDMPSACAINCVYGAKLQDIYVSETSIIPIFNEKITKRTTKGCYSNYERYENVHLFKLSPTTLKIIDGVTLNDYTVYDRRAIKDYGDTIYIAATKRDGSGTTVIALDGLKFSLLNKLEKIAPNESVKSVTFGEEDGKRYCYITTFLQVDPLFKIDVTDPYRMKTLGYMKVPGFSTFMLNVGDKLITLGYDSDGAQGTVSDVKISLYDSSSDELKPIDDRIIKNVVYLEGISDPRAIAVSGTYFAFSATTKRSGSSAEYTQSLYVFEVTSNELLYLGKVTNFSLNESYGNGSIDYVDVPNSVSGEVAKTTNFGKYALSVQRARFIDNYVYTFSDGVISSHLLGGEGSEKYVAENPTQKVFTHLGTNRIYTD